MQANIEKTGILLTNTGTPDAPTPQAVRRYLREFLSDKRIVKIPRIIWLPILHGIILTTRPKKSAKLYHKIWTPAGSPMRVHMERIVDLLRAQGYVVEIGMNYGTPSIRTGLEKLRSQSVDQIIVLPIFPQFSYTSSGSSFDRVFAATKKWGDKPSIQLIHHYAEQIDYIDALAASVHAVRKQDDNNRHLLISFHGIPERFVRAGDPYQTQCEATANKLAAKLGLTHDQWTLCYQSQFGYDQWLKPSTQLLFDELPARGIKDIDIICPGFAVDCLETLEEIAIQGKKQFLAAGGNSFRYIEALNEGQVDMLVKVIMTALR